MKKGFLLKVVFALFGILLVGIGVGFNASALLGNDPIAILYDGIRNIAGLGYESLGLITNLVNLSVLILLLFIGRRYLNIGTIIYMLSLGTFVNLGNYLYGQMFTDPSIIVRFSMGIIGSLLIYTGVGIFILMDIGLDLFTAFAMVINDRLGWEFRKTKICFDIILVVTGTLLGGTLGIITIFTALTAGPCIQWVVTKLKVKLKV